MAVAPSGTQAGALGNGLVLRVIDLTTYFFLRDRVVKAVDGVDLEVCSGETVALVGESGSGKTVTGLSILRLVPPPGRVLRGSIQINGEDVTRKSGREMEKLRGPAVTMVFQNPRAALDPFFTVGDQLIETAAIHRKVKRFEARAEVLQLLEMVRVSNIHRLMHSYPHELSGGECQRAMIAMALLCRPRLLIADEPTSALDATVQAEILTLLRELKDRFGMSLLLVTHDFGVVASMADHIVVMYAGKVVETGPAEKVLSDPQHPYTSGLLRAVPKVGQRPDRLVQIEGQPPDVSRLPPGCSFAPRCPEKVPLCENAEPELKALAADRLARCHLRGDVPPQEVL